MNLKVLVASLALLATAQAGIAESHLNRPDPGIGEGFANAMAEQFMEEFDIGRAEADCLVYEVMEHARSTGYAQDMLTIAAQVMDRCGL